MLMSAFDLALHYPGPAPLLPADSQQALPERLWDRFFDLYVSADEGLAWPDHGRRGPRPERRPLPLGRRPRPRCPRRSGSCRARRRATTVLVLSPTQVL
jgi:hypothetical protein